MSKKLLAILLIISVAINIMAAVMFGRFQWHVHEFRSRGKPPVMGPFRDWGKGIMRQKLDLTEEQVEKLNVLQKTLEPKISLLREELQRTGKEMILIWKEPEPDTIKAESLYQYLIDVQRDMEAHMFEHIKSVHKILTQEQRDRLFEMMEKHPMLPKERPGP